MTSTLQQHCRALQARFDNYSLRERLLLLLAAIALSYGAWDQLLMQPLSEQQQRTASELSAQRQLLVQGEQEILLLLGDDREAASPEAREIEALQAEVNALDERLRAATEGLMPPQRMTHALKELLASESGLQLTSLQSKPPQRQQQPDESADGEERATAEPALYRHGFSLRFEGDYLATLRYLRALETLPWRVYCERLQFQSEAYPRASIILDMYTLSLSEDWIGA